MDIALDTNILIHLIKSGRDMLNGCLDEESISPAEEVHALAEMIDVWMVRDIRFHISPLNVDDAKKDLPEERRAERARALLELAAAITCHNGGDLDWSVSSEDFEPKKGLTLNFQPPLFKENLQPIDLEKLETLLGEAPAGFDRRLLREAVYHERHIFISCDKKLVSKASGLKEFGLLVISPSALLALFEKYGINGMFGGFGEHDGCKYSSPTFPDSHKWVHLMGVFDRGDW